MRRRTPPGFTLIESLAALAVTSILLVALVSVIGLSARAVPSGEDRTDHRAAASGALATATDELRDAAAIVSASPTSIRVVLNDADGNPVEVEYAWEGEPGQPLLRSEAGVSSVVVPNVRSFLIDLVQEDRVRPIEGAEPVKATGGEVLLASWTGVGSTTDRVRGTTMVGMVVRPNLPASAVGWRITRFRYRGTPDTGGRTVSTIVQIRPAGIDDRPTSAVLAQSSTSENGLILLGLLTASWREHTFAALPEVDPTVPLCVVLSSNNANGGVALSRTTSGAFSAFGQRVWTTDGGATWNADRDSAFEYEVYGTVTTASFPTEAYSVARRAELRLRVGSDDAPEMRTAFRLVSNPEVP